jgi:ubiquitin-protein ligase
VLNSGALLMESQSILTISPNFNVSLKVRLIALIQVPFFTLFLNISGGVFELEVVIPQNYPFRGPKYKFVTVIYHPWVNEDGTICFQGKVAPS